MKDSDFRMAITSAMTIEAISAMQLMGVYSCPTEVKNREHAREVGIHALNVLLQLAKDSIDGEDYCAIAEHYERERDRLMGSDAGIGEQLPVAEVQELEGCRG